MVALTLEQRLGQFGITSSLANVEGDNVNYQMSTTGWFAGKNIILGSTAAEQYDPEQSLNPEFNDSAIGVMIHPSLIKSFQLIAFLLACVGGGGITIAIIGFYMALPPILWQSGILAMVSGLGLSMLAASLYERGLKNTIASPTMRLQTGTDMDDLHDRQTSTSDVVQLDIDRTETRSTY